MTTLREPRILILAAVAVVLARSLGGSLPYFILYSVIGVLLLARVWAAGIGRELYCHYAVDRRALTAGESVAVEVRLGNESLWPAVWLRAVDRTVPGQPALDTAFSLGPQSSRVFRYRLPPLRRGIYRPGPLTLTWGDPFGFFSGERVVTSETRITVYPRVARLDDLALPARQPFGSLRTRERAFQDPSHLAEVRPYRQGDHLKCVHWRTTARRGRLFVKEYELTASAELHVALDLQRLAYAAATPAAEPAVAPARAARAAPPGQPVTDVVALDLAVEAAAAAADFAARRGFSVGLVAAGAQRLDVPCGAAKRRLREIMEVLTAAEADGSLPLAEVLAATRRRLSSHATVFAITPALSDDLVAELLAMRRAGFWPGLCIVGRGGPPAGGETGHAAEGETGHAAEGETGHAAEGQAGRTGARIDLLRQAGVAVWPVAPGEPLEVALAGSGGPRRPAAFSAAPAGARRRAALARMTYGTAPAQGGDQP